ncbi:excinuclease ABC subunit A [archaeon]|nr:excinuclease ABC subunit A [archaeon]|tara:strand:+ start:2270 stop:5089 length:2820 start_codon:yes stop_codon:yes gene_type:complete
MPDKIIVKGAQEHNLKNIDVELPRDKLIVFTGISGSGKSTLAFDTIYAEGQRRYVESLSAYARQFLGVMNKPDVESIEGLSPAISIEQKTTSKNPRSTVGTVTEIYDYLRLLYARIGEPHCPECGEHIKGQSAQKIVQQILMLPKERQIMILAPILKGKKGTHEQQFKELLKQGYTKVRVDGEIYDTADVPKLKRYVKHSVEAIIDLFDLKDPDKTRVTEAVEKAIKLSSGTVEVLQEDTLKAYSTHLACTTCGISFEDLQPRDFSFNSPFGACQTCHGLGMHLTFDPELIIPNKKLSIFDGAIAPWKNAQEGFRAQMLESVAKHFKFSLFEPIKKLKKKHLDILLHGSTDAIRYNYNAKNTDANWNYVGKFEGLLPRFQRLYKETKSDRRREEFEQYMTEKICETCNGGRLKKESLAVKVNDKQIADITDLSVTKARDFFVNMELTPAQQAIAKLIRKEINDRLRFLDNVGLGYLTLSRRAGTLSGGEAQRIRLATQIGANLAGVLYVLDEPSIGLHQRDNQKLVKTLCELRDLGNTLIVVEHDEETIRAADYVVDIGPGAGRHGGDIVAQGSVKTILESKKSLTGQYLSGEKQIVYNHRRRKLNGAITIKQAAENNLKEIDVEIPLGVLCVVTGVSGSGKSTLVNEILTKALQKNIYRSRVIPGKHKKIDGLEKIDKVVTIDQSPIGRTPRSNPATYTGLFTPIREMFSVLPESKIRGYTQSRFSFNLSEGRCGNCQGDGLIKIEMHFLPDVYVECEECKGKRYNDETLDVTYKNKNIADILDMTVEEALTFFRRITRVNKYLQLLSDVGLGYIKLGQSATTLSGGEAQRIKLASELSKVPTGNTIYILDEPTTGLHFEDVRKLLEVLDRLVQRGNSVLVIEHNLDVIKTADWIIDLGPEGGDGGGTVVCAGSPEQVANHETSHTGQHLKKILNGQA